MTGGPDSRWPWKSSQIAIPDAQLSKTPEPMTIEVEDGKMVISRAPDVLFSSRQTRLTLRLDGEDLNTVVLQEFEDVKEVNIESMLPTVNAFGREVRAGSVEASRLEIHSAKRP